MMVAPETSPTTDPGAETLIVVQVAPVFARPLPLLAAESELGYKIGFDMAGRDKPVVWLCEGAPAGRWCDTLEAFAATFAIVESELEPPPFLGGPQTQTPGWVRAIRRSSVLVDRSPGAFRLQLPSGSWQDWQARDYRLTDRQGFAWGLSPATLATAFAPVSSAALRQRAIVTPPLTCSLCSGSLPSMRPLGGRGLAQDAALMPVCPRHGELDDPTLLELVLSLDIARHFVTTTMPNGDTVWLAKAISDQLLMLWDQSRA